MKGSVLINHNTDYKSDMKVYKKAGDNKYVGQTNERTNKEKTDFVAGT